MNSVKIYKRVIDVLPPDTKDAVLTHLIKGNVFQASGEIAKLGHSRGYCDALISLILKDEGF